MSPQTETKAGVGFQAGVKDYKLTETKRWAVKKVEEVGWAVGHI